MNKLMLDYDGTQGIQGTTLIMSNTHGSCRLTTYVRVADAIATSLQLMFRDIDKTSNS